MNTLLQRTGMSTTVGKIARSTLFKFALWLALTFVGVRLVSWLDTRHPEAGDAPHPTFRVLLLGGEQPFMLSSLKELPEVREKYPNAALLLPEGAGDFTGPADFIHREK
jgi:hypothetical protein